MYPQTSTKTCLFQTPMCHVSSKPAACRFTLWTTPTGTRATWEAFRVPTTSRNIVDMPHWLYWEAVDPSINPFPTTTRVSQWCSHAIPLINRNPTPVDIVRACNPNNVLAIPNCIASFCLSTVNFKPPRNINPSKAPDGVVALAECPDASFVDRGGKF